MPDHTPTSTASLAPLPPELDRVCDRFEAAWKQAEGTAPRLEEYLEAAPTELRAALLGELLALEVAYRRRRGEEPTPEEYRVRFGSQVPPGLADLFDPPKTDRPAAASKRLHCPHCFSPLSLSGRSADDVLCPACGGSFQVQRPGPEAAPERLLGKFRLLERVGVGGFGTVWRAHDTELDRQVALKIPHTGLLPSAQELDRFHREARAAAQLRHPGIVPVHDVVLLDDLPVIISDFIEGMSLKELLASRRLTFREAAALLADVADAVEYAHAAGLVHRDVKPGNILLDCSQGRGIGRPLLTDFGLALRDGAEVTLTLDGHLLGTPAYMSPEQAAGRSHQADRRSDVYSLGVVLYELLCGELPFRGSKLMILDQVLKEEPRPPRRINDRIPRDLETICLKALAKEPHRRYPTAAELRDDLRHYLRGEPIRARSVRSWERALLWLRRRPGTAAAYGLFLVAALFGGLGAGATWLWQGAEQARRTADEARAETADALGREQEARKREQMWRDQLARVWNEDPESGADVLGRQRQRHEGPVQDVSCSSDGTLVASGGNDRVIRLWRTDTFEPAGVLQAKRPVANLLFAPSEGRRLASVGSDGVVQLWDLARPEKPVFEFAGHAKPQLVSFSPDSRRLAYGGPNGTLWVYDCDTSGPRELTTDAALRHINEINASRFSPDGRWLYVHEFNSPGHAGCAFVWDLQATPPRRSPQLEPPTGPVAFLDSRTLLGCNKEGAVWAWDLAQKEPWMFSFSRAAHILQVRALAVVEEGRAALSVSTDGIIQAWQLRYPPEGQPVLEKNGEPVKSPNQLLMILVAPGGRRVVAKVGDGMRLRLWALEQGRPQGAGELLPMDQITCCRFTPDGGTLVTGETDGKVRLWDVTGERILERSPREGHTAAVASLAFGPGDAALLSGGADGSARLWDLRAAPPREVHSWRAAQNGPMPAAWTPGGRLLFTAGPDGRLTRWTADPRDARGDLVASDLKNPVMLAVAPDGSWLAVSEGRPSGAGGKSQEAGTVRLWHLPDGEARGALPGLATRCEGLAFSPDGTLLATGGGEEEVRFWDLTASPPREREKLSTLGARVGPLAFSADGRLLAVGTDAGVQVWEWTGARFRQRAACQGFRQRVCSVAFTADGTRVAAGGLNGLVGIWDTASGEKLRQWHRTGAVQALAFRADSARLAIGKADGTVELIPWQ